MSTAAEIKSNDRMEWVSDFVAGWVSGAVSIVACQPVDTILTRWQAASPSSSSSILAATTNPIGLKNTSSYYKHWREMTFDLYRTSGPRAFWRGASPVIIAAPIQNALLMGGYGFGSRYFSTYDKNYNDIDSYNNCGTKLSRSKQLGAIFVGGFAGGVLQSFLMSPVELVKVAQQCATTRTSTSTNSMKNGYTMISVAQNIFANRTIMSGLNATLLRDGIPHGVWFVAYDVSKVTLRPYCVVPDTKSPVFTNTETVPISVSLTSGAVAATIAWTVGYPADLIKTRIQASSISLGGRTQPQQQGILETAQIIIREADGHIWNGLYRGFGMKLVRSIPASMIGFTVYEAVKEQILCLSNTRSTV